MDEDTANLTYQSSRLEGIEDNSKKIFLCPYENLCSDPSLETTCLSGSNDGSQNTF